MLSVYMTEYQNISDEFDLNQMKITAYCEATLGQFNINLREAELKVMKESGTIDDLEYLFEAAENGVIVAIRNAMKAIIDNFAKFITNVKNTVVVGITSVKTKETIKRIEKILKENPRVAKEKIKIMDTKKILGVISSYKSKCDKNVAKISKVTTILGNEYDSIDGVISDRADFSDKILKMTKKDVVLVTVTIGTALMALDSDIKELKNRVDKCDKETSAVLKELQKTISSEAQASTKAAYNAVANFRTEIGKTEVNLAVKSINDKISAIKKGIKEFKGNTAGEKIEESVEDFNLEPGEEFLEGANLEIRAIFKKSKKETNDALKEVKKYLKESKYKEAKKSVNKIKTGLNNSIIDIEKIESSLGSMLFGLVTSELPRLGNNFKNTIPALTLQGISIGSSIIACKGIAEGSEKYAKYLALGATAGTISYIYSSVYNIYLLIDKGIGVLNNISKKNKTGKEITVDDFNLYKITSIKMLKNYIKVCDNLIDVINGLEKAEKEISKSKSNISKKTKTNKSNSNSAVKEATIDDLFGDLDDLV